MRFICFALALGLSSVAEAQSVSIDVASAMTPAELFQQLAHAVPFQPESFRLLPGPDNQLRSVIFWSRPRASANGITCEVDAISFNLTPAEHSPAIASARLYRALPRTVANREEECAALQPESRSFFRANSGSQAGEAVRILRDLRERVESNNMRGMSLTCANCEDPRAALLALENERLSEVSEDRCTPEERWFMCLEFRYQGPPYGGWRLRTDRNAFARLTWYGGLVLH